MRVNKLLPRLVVADATRAMAFYGDVLGATQTSCHRSSDGKVVQAELSMDGVSFYLKDADQYDRAPAKGGGAPVILMLHTDDSDALYRAAIDHGAEVIYPLDTRPYGARDARIRDPFGHVWILTTAVGAGD